MGACVRGCTTSNQIISQQGPALMHDVLQSSGLIIVQ